jgi:predicted amidophosphoribosyltransferase
MPVCPNCGNQAAENAIFCDQCGTRLPAVEAEPVAPAAVAEVESAPGGVPEGVLICPNCGAENVPGEVFCDVCGEPLEAPEPVPSAAVSAEPEAVVEVELEPVLDAEPALEVETVLEVAEAEAEPATSVEPAAAAGQTYCPVCGAAIHPGDTFCGTCGASLTTAAEEQSLVEEPVVVEAAAAEETAVEEIVAEEVVVEEPVVVEAEVEAVPETPVAETAAEEAVVEEIIVEEPVVIETEAEAAEEPVVIEEAVVVEAEVEAAGEQAAAEEQAVAEAEEPRCPVCGAIVLPGQRFCASCGAALPAAPGAGAQPAAAQPAVVPETVPEEAAPEAVVPEPVAPAATEPYLEVTDSGAHIPLIAQAELLIGRVDDVSGIYPDVDMTPHGGEDGGVSRRHALLGHDQGAWYVVDLDSTNGTYVNGAEVAPQVRVPVQDGDRIGLGDAEVVLHIP